MALDILSITSRSITSTVAEYFSNTSPPAVVALSIILTPPYSRFPGASWGTPRSAIAPRYAMARVLNLVFSALAAHDAERSRAQASRRQRGQAVVPSRTSPGDTWCSSNECGTSWIRLQSVSGMAAPFQFALLLVAHPVVVRA